MMRVFGVRIVRRMRFFGAREVRSHLESLVGDG
jgi:hypothetical protein